MFTQLMLSLCILTSHQSYGFNCLRANPGLVDTTLNFFPEVGNLMPEPEANAHQISLAHSRFKRVHNIQGGNNKAISVLDALSQFAKTSNDTSPWILLPPFDLRSRNLTEAVTLYQNVYNAVEEINSAHENTLIAGLYLPRTYIFSSSNNTRMQLDAVNSVFGSKNASRVSLGFVLEDCFLDVQNPQYLEHFQRLHFITCPLNGKLFWNASKIPSPEEYAYEVIKRWDQLRDNAKALRLTAEILCLASYPSQEKTKNGIVGSVEGFERFWCRIIHKLAHNKSHAGIIMESAFDNIYELYGKTEPSGEYNTGWWRRLSLNGDRMEYIEKVEELVGGEGYGKCRGMCQICKSQEDCCPRTKCEVDNELQVVTIPQNMPRFCNFPRVICNPLIVSQIRRSAAGTSTTVPSKSSTNTTLQLLPLSPTQESFNSNVTAVDILTGTICTIAGAFVVGITAVFILRRRKGHARQEAGRSLGRSPSSMGRLAELPLTISGNVENLSHRNEMEVEMTTL